MEHTCQICKSHEPQYPTTRIGNEEFYLCVWCSSRMAEYVRGNITHDAINIVWGGGRLGFSCWERIREFLRVNNIKDLLEYGTGLSTELFVNEGLNVITLDTYQRHSNLYAEHNWIKQRAKVIWYPSADELPEFDRVWDFVFVDGPHERSGETRHAMRYAANFLMLHDPNLGEQEFFPNDDWEEADDKIWKRKVPLTTPIPK